MFFLERRMPGKNGEGTPRVLFDPLKLSHTIEGSVGIRRRWPVKGPSWVSFRLRMGDMRQIWISTASKVSQPKKVGPTRPQHRLVSFLR